MLIDKFHDHVFSRHVLRVIATLFTLLFAPKRQRKGSPDYLADDYVRNVLNATAIAILALTFPSAAMADISGGVTLNIGQSLSLDTGIVSSAAPGGDFVWTGSTILPQGSATAVNLGGLTASGFGVLTQNYLTTVVTGYSNVPIPKTSLSLRGDVFAVHTNGGNYAAVLVTLIGVNSIYLHYTTFGVASAPTGPTITQVLNNFSLIPAGFPNSGIAQGSLFVVQGSDLAFPAVQAVLQPSASGLPLALNGASVSVTVNGTTVIPAFYYAVATQLGLVLPSKTPIGTGTLTVTYNGQTSTAFPIEVVQSAMGFGIYNGLAVATNNAGGALYNYSNSIPPGSTIVLWGSGLGADPARDTQYVPATFEINTLGHIYVGGVEAPIYYQGASGFPGVNQVNVTIPANAPTGCNVPLVGINLAGVPTNTVTLPVGGGPCTPAP